MASLNFVNAGPAVKEYDESRNRANDRAWQETVRDRALRDDVQKQGVDAALREGVRGQRSALANVQARPEIALTGDDEGNPLPPESRVVVQKATAAPAPSRFGGAIDKLAQTRGGGQAAMTLMNQEETRTAASRTATRLEGKENREQHLKGLEAFNKAMDAGDLDVAKVVNRQFELGIPDQIFASRQGISRIRGISSILHRNGIRGETAAEVFRSALENPDQPVDQALRSGMAAGADRVHKNDLIETPTGYFNLRTQEVQTDGNGNAVMPPKRRLDFAPPRAAPGGGAGAGLRVQSTKQLADGRIAVIMSDGSQKMLNDEKGQPLRGPEAANRAARLVGKMLSSIQTPQERNDAVTAGVSIADRIGREAGQPAPAAPPARRLRFDAQGNPVQ